MHKKATGFIIYPTYRIEQNEARVYLFGRLDTGESFVTVNDFSPYFFIKKKDLKKALESVSEDFDHEDAGLKNFDEEPVVRISVNIPKQVPILRERFEKNGIVCYEADIRFAYRFIIDNNIFGTIDIEGEYTKGEHVDRVYDNPLIKAHDGEFDGNLKVLSIDIETSFASKDFEDVDLYSISLYTEGYKKVLIVSDKKELDNAICFKSEKDMLERFAELVKQLDPDIITGWNVVDFDLQFLEKKFQEHDISFAIGRTEDRCRLKISKDFFRDSKADFFGRIVLDGLYLIKNSFIKLDDYKLDTAAMEFLGEKKLIGHENKVWQVEEYYRKDPQKLVDYNLKDAKLVYDILEKKNLIRLSMQRETLTGMQMDRINASIAALDSIYLRELRKRGYVALSSAFSRKELPLKGGFVMSSKPGVYDHVIVCDFKSLYPSVIRTFNIDPLCFVKDCKGHNLIKAPNGACFRREGGILPGILQRLWEQRDKAKKKKDAVASYALKIVMNSFWGSLGSPNCRYFDWKMANAITGFSQMVIKTTIAKIQEMGYDVIYGDTDSVFVALDVKNVEEAEKIGGMIPKDINKFFGGYVSREYGQKKCYIELEFEKAYKRFLMPRVRKSETGAKKRYAGLLVVNGKEKIDFTGLEFVRRDWTELSKKFQLELLDLIFHKKEVAGFVKRFVKDLTSGKYDEFLVYRKAIRKNVDEYTKTTPPHVKAARKLGRTGSGLIEYVMTKDGPEAVEKQEHSIDYEHYISKQIKPIADSVLCFYKQNFDEIVQGSTQKGLGDY